MTEREAYIALNMIDGLGPVKVRSLVTALGSAQAVFTATADDLKNEGLVAKAERKLAGSPAWQKLMATLPKTEREDIKRFGIAQWIAGGAKAEMAEDGSDEKK